MNITYILQINLSLKTNNKIVITNTTTKLWKLLLKAPPSFPMIKKSFLFLLCIKKKITLQNQT